MSLRLTTVIRRIAIFGGAGLLGQSLIRRLLDLKNIELPPPILGFPDSCNLRFTVLGEQ